jgi:tRNA (cytidine/uridine-2'-O-)-methyltransferase
VIRLALYQPDMPPNVGTLLRLGACLGVPVHIIEPCGFPYSEKAVRRSALDYLEHAEIASHASFAAFLRDRPAGRLLLLSRHAAQSYIACSYRPDDILLMGRESAGIGPDAREAADLAVHIPLRPGMRSINVALAAAMVLSEALRQTGQFQNGQFSMPDAEGPQGHD